MKKVLMAVLSVLLIVALAILPACERKDVVVDSNTENESSEGSLVVEEEFADETVEDEMEDTEKTETPNIEIASLLPDPKDYFAQGEFNVVVPDDGENYFIRVTNYQDGEYKAYVNACKEGNFSKVHYEDDTIFMAYTEDESYYLQVPFVESAGSVDIVCNFVTND